MKYFLLLITLITFSSYKGNAQATRELRGTILDSTKLSLPGSNIKLTSDKGDSVIAIADVNGKYIFPAVKGIRINLAITSIGFQAIIKHFTLDNGTGPVTLDPIVLQSDTRQLAQVTITGVNPVVFKEDTVQYSVSAYKVRENAPIEDVLKKIPGIDVAKDGTVSSQGKQITKVRVNGKDFFGGDVQSATKNLPADVIESVQVVDDYGDQANLTGVKTGEPNKILNFTIRKDKNYGYFGQATVGDGTDALPKNPGVSNDNRYLGLVNFFKFKGDQQISVLGSINNTNVNTFSFGSATGGAAGGGGFGGGGGGGGRGNALRGSTGSTTNANGITDAHSIGLNFRDQWGKNLSVYGSYSFSNNTTFTNSTTLQQNNGLSSSTSNQLSQETSNPINHRFNFNVEWKPDTLNYLKITPTFTYTGTDISSFDDVTSTQGGTTNLAYTSNSVTNTTSPNYGVTGFYNHKFKGTKRNIQFGFGASSNKNNQVDNPIYNYTVIDPRTLIAPTNQIIYTDSRTNAFNGNVSYLEPIGKVSFLELRYELNHSYTTSDKETDTLFTTNPDRYQRYDLLSNNYNYTFTTNRFALNYKIIEKKYNVTLGVGAQPATLSGVNTKTNTSTSVSTFNVIPTASFNYNFSRSQSFRLNYNGSSNQPAFNQLQPVTDFSNALYPVQGNPDLKPEFTNSLSLQYNAFSFQTGNIFLIRGQFTQTDNKIVQNIVTNGGTNLIRYLNTSGYYSATGNILYSKPWSERKYTVIFGSNVGYVNNIGFSQSVDANNVETALDKNIAKTFTLAPQLRFRVNVAEIIDAELNTSYAINKTVNSSTNLSNDNTNIRALNFGISGKNYVWKDWTLSYDYTKSLNYGYAIPIKNPNLLNAYVERRFLKDHRGTLRLAAYDLFNENTGFSTTTNGSIVTQTNVNRLGRYVLLTFTLRLQKFSGKSPTQDPGRGFRNGGGQGGPGGGPGTGGGMGGPPAGGGPM